MANQVGAATVRLFKRSYFYNPADTDEVATRKMLGYALRRHWDLAKRRKYSWRLLAKRAVANLGWWHSKCACVRGVETYGRLGPGMESWRHRCQWCCRFNSRSVTGGRVRRGRF